MVRFGLYCHYSGSWSPWCSVRQPVRPTPHLGYYIIVFDRALMIPFWCYPLCRPPLGIKEVSLIVWRQQCETNYNNTFITNNVTGVTTEPEEVAARRSHQKCEQYAIKPAEHKTKQNSITRVQWYDTVLCNNTNYSIKLPPQCNLRKIKHALTVPITNIQHSQQYLHLVQSVHYLLLVCVMKKQDASNKNRSPKTAPWASGVIVRVPGFAKQARDTAWGG